MAALCLACSCSSDDDDEKGFNLIGSTSRPSWQIDWTWHDATPQWKDPLSTQYECSMNMLVYLSEEFMPYTTDDDVMAVFINDECRGVSYRNVTSDGYALFLLLVKGNSEEAAHDMQLRYYCSGMKQMFVSNSVPPFMPNNLMEDTYQMLFSPAFNSTKYPFFTQLSVMLPENTPFTITNNDMMAVFVGDECRGLCTRDERVFPGWKGGIFSKEKDETAQIRYYSAKDKSIYTFDQSFTLNCDVQKIEINFN